MKLCEILLCFTLPLAPPALAQRVEIAPFLDNRQAALSLTFDDGLKEHYTMVYPLLQRLGLRGSFALIGSKMGDVVNGKYKNMPCMTWDEARDMAQHGQEMSNHGYAHRNVATLNADELSTEVLRNDSLIARYTGQLPRTYFYPGNKKTDEAVDNCSIGRTCTRTFQVNLGGKRTTQWLAGYLSDLIRQHQWGVTMTHGIATGYDHFEDPQVFAQLMEYVASKRDSIWIAPLREIGAYIEERDNIHLDVHITRKKIILRPTLNLDPKIYNMPITVLINGRPYNIDPYKRQVVFKRKIKKTYQQ